MNKYPVYRKFRNGKEFHKVISDTHSVSVLKMRTGYRIIVCANTIHMADVMDDALAMDSTRDEFEKVYGEAMWELNRANTVV